MSLVVGAGDHCAAPLRSLSASLAPAAALLVAGQGQAATSIQRIADAVVHRLRRAGSQLDAAVNDEPQRQPADAAVSRLPSVRSESVMRSGGAGIDHSASVVDASTMAQRYG